MKTQNNLALIAAEYRAKNGNCSVKSYIGAVGKHKEFKADEIKAEIIRQSLLSEQRKTLQTIPSVREWVKNVIIRKLKTIANALPSMGYSMGAVYAAETRAGRSIYTAQVDKTQEYAISSRYKAIHGYHILTLTPAEYRKIQIIGGLITQVLQPISKGIYKAEWLYSTGSKNHYTTHWQNGYLYSDFHFTAGSDTEAKKIVKERRERLLIQERERKAQEKLSKIAAHLNLSHVWVSLEDSLNAGNCLSGTQNFAQHKGINLNEVGAVRADWLLQNANGSAVYVNRAIESARFRKAKDILH